MLATRLGEHPHPSLSPKGERARLARKLWRQPLFTGRQVVAIQHSHPVAHCPGHSLSEAYPRRRVVVKGGEVLGGPEEGGARSRAGLALHLALRGLSTDRAHCSVGPCPRPLRSSPHPPPNGLSSALALSEFDFPWTGAHLLVLNSWPTCFEEVPRRLPLLREQFHSCWHRQGG